MPTIEQTAQEIVAREGGWVKDPGGATKYGVTIGTLRRFGLDLTGDGKVTEADLHRLTRAQAADVFLRHYLRAPGIDQLPEVLQASLRHVGERRRRSRPAPPEAPDRHGLRLCRGSCAVDGVIGPRTVAAAEAAPLQLADAYGIARRNYYYALADVRPASRKFARRRDGGKGGWITRAEAFISPRFHLTDAQHRARTAAWA